MAKKPTEHLIFKWKKTLGEHAYEAYIRVRRENLAYQEGLEWDWEDMPNEDREGWEAAALEAARWYERTVLAEAGYRSAAKAKPEWRREMLEKHCHAGAQHSA